ncbi:hypothetical protein IMSAGC013_03790 [Lachnospiraceae bacterium]|nr:hypothetical protein IMSAGC013_03790 [Lachnospiraceae bacterium]
MNKTIILKRKTDIKVDRYHARAVTMTAMLAAVSYILAFFGISCPAVPGICPDGTVGFPGAYRGVCFWAGFRHHDWACKKWVAAAIYFNGRCWGAGKFPDRGFLCVGGGLYL